MISIPNFQPSDLSPEDLESISKVLRKHNIEKIRFGTNNRLSVELPEGTDLDAVIDELDEFSKPGNANGITYVRSCPAKDQCKYSCADAPEIGKRIENIELPRPLTAKVKVSIAGCHMCCSEPYIRDIGLVATKKGWRLLFGGNGGGRPRIGDMVAEELTDDQAVELIRRCLIFYQDNAGKKKRTARFMETIGIKALRSAVLTDLTDTVKKAAITCIFHEQR